MGTFRTFNIGVYSTKFYRHVIWRFLSGPTKNVAKGWNPTLLAKLHSCLVEYFVRWFKNVLLQDSTDTTLSCPSNNNVGLMVDFISTRDAEADTYHFAVLC